MNSDATGVFERSFNEIFNVQAKADPSNHVNDLRNNMNVDAALSALLILEWDVSRVDSHAELLDIIGFKEQTIPIIFTHREMSINSYNGTELESTFNKITMKHQSHSTIICLTQKPVTIKNGFAHIKVYQLLLGAVYQKNTDTWSWLIYSKDHSIERQINVYPCNELVSVGFDDNEKFSLQLFDQYKRLVSK